MALKIIGAGFGRTGTMSLKLALEELGYGRCYHMIELTNEPENVRYWEQALSSKKPNWDQLFEGYQSITDFPGCLFYKELLAQYPDARVILTTRDPEKWYRSAAATIFKARPNFSQFLKISRSYLFSKRTRQLMRLGWLINRLIYGKAFAYRQSNKKKAIEAFLNHNEEVKKYVPSEQLLVYQVSQGWEPLCDFLGKPVPDKPFPKTNKADHFHRMKNLSLDGPVSEKIKRM